MSRKLGYHITYAGEKCLSITTGTQSDGTFDFLIHALGVDDRHVHGYASLSSEGFIQTGGARVKNNIGEYLGTGMTLSETTQEIARVVISQSPAGPICQFKQDVGSEWLVTGPCDLGGEIYRTEIALPVTSHTEIVEYSISMIDARTGIPPNSSERMSVQFSGKVPFGVVFEVYNQPDI